MAQKKYVFKKEYTNNDGFMFFRRKYLTSECIKFTQRLDQMFTSEKSYKFVSCTVAIFSEMGIDEHTYYN